MLCHPDTQVQAVVRISPHLMIHATVTDLPQTPPSVITVEEYQRLSDRVFDSLTDYLEEVVEDYDGPDADEVEVEYYVSEGHKGCQARSPRPLHL